MSVPKPLPFLLSKFQRKVALQGMLFGGAVFNINKRINGRCFSHKRRFINIKEKKQPMNEFILKNYILLPNDFLSENN